jgi:zinc transport system ATP-binding protein
MTPLVELKGVSFNYDAVSVLDDVSLAVEPVDFLGIIGPNGAGKTTLIKIILGLLRPAGGEVGLFGEPIESFTCWHRIGYVPQKIALDPQLPVTVQEVVTTGLAYRSGFLCGGHRRGARQSWIAGRRADQERAVETLALVGMAGHRTARIGALSVGQQQRVLIARALVTEPEVLILDEPTGGVDPEAQAEFYALLHTLNRHRGVTLILVSHDLAVISKEVTKLACLNRRLIFHGDPGAFLTDAGLAALYGPSVHVISHLH